jgi:5-hydroxyisourate hydrolase-like protein (transthyretin family)
MICMVRRTSLRLSAFLAVMALTFCTFHAGAQDDNSHRGRKFKTPPPSSRIEISVIRDSNGKPVEHAAVIFHPVEGDKDKGIMELKTNEDGKAVVDVIPIGDTVRLQIIAKGFQTYGEDFKVDKPEIAMEIRMKRPGQQYSIYRNNSDTANSGNDSGADTQKSAEKPAEQAPPKQQ